MDVYWLSDAGAERQDVAALPSLLVREDGFVWVDIPECDEAASRVLADVFGFHPLAIKHCRERTHAEGACLPRSSPDDCPWPSAGGGRSRRPAGT
jgi:Mg2+ and Co2+ transporter CorA